MSIKYEIAKLKYRIKNDLVQWLAHRLPKRLRYFAAIDVVAYATTGEYSSTEVYSLTAMEAIRRFEKKAGL